MSVQVSVFLAGVVIAFSSIAFVYMGATQTCRYVHVPPREYFADLEAAMAKARASRLQADRDYELGWKKIFLGFAVLLLGFAVVMAGYLIS